MRSVKCPRCDGAGKTFGMACPGFVPVEMECLVCHGAGAVSQETVEQVAEGRAIAKRRISKDLSLRELAKKLGVRPTRMSEIERGLKAPTAAERDLIEEALSFSGGSGKDADALDKKAGEL